MKIPQDTPSTSDGYEIDYEDLDVVDLVAQVRERVRRSVSSVELPPDVAEERIRARLRTWLDLDDKRPYELQRSLRLEGTWNVSPEDLRVSGRRGLGRLIAVCRSLARPALKFVANTELPLYKQFKINLGVAEALHELLRQNAQLLAHVDELARRLETLEAEAARRLRSQPPGGDEAERGVHSTASRGEER